MGSGATLAVDALDRYRPLGAFGQPVHRSHPQLQAALRQRLGEKYANFFAAPLFDSGSRTVSWVSPVAGEAVRWSDLPEGEQAARALDLQVMKSELDRYIGELKAHRGEERDGGGARAFAAVLEQALRTPDDRHLFFVGDQPVAAFWGFQEENAPPFETLTAAPAVAARAGPAAPGPAVASVAKAAPPRRRVPWWLLLGLLLLLAALLLWWLWPAPAPFPESDDRGGAPAAAAPHDPPAENERSEPRRRLPAAVGEDAVVGRRDPAVVGGAPAGEEEVLPGLAGERPVVPDGSGPEDGAEAGDGQGDEAPGVEASADDGPGEEAAEPPVPPVPTEDAPPEPEPPPSVPEAAPEPGGAPEIPDGARDGAAGFMQGAWQSDSGLVDARTKQKLVQEYTFDDQGRGEAVIRRADGVVCRAPAEAAMRDGKLQVDELENLECTDGSSFSRSRTVCTKDPSGAAQCVGTDADGNRFTVDLNRGGGQ